MEKEINILKKVHEILELTGNPYLVDIFNKYRGDTEKLYNALCNYIKGIYYEINDEEEEVEEGKEKKIIPKYVFLKNIVIDSSNISRIELGCNYNSNRNKNDYFIKIVKKYPSPLEEEYIIYFNSEKERNEKYEILKGKLKLCNIYIM